MLTPKQALKSFICLIQWFVYNWQVLYCTYRINSRIYNLYIFFVSDLLEGNQEQDVEAVQKARHFYQSCMNESKHQMLQKSDDLSKYTSL